MIPDRLADLRAAELGPHQHSALHMALCQAGHRIGPPVTVAAVHHNDREAGFVQEAGQGIGAFHIGGVVQIRHQHTDYTAAFGGHCLLGTFQIEIIFLQQLQNLIPFLFFHTGFSVQDAGNRAGRNICSPRDIINGHGMAKLPPEMDLYIPIPLYCTKNRAEMQ